jgi:hypothetical protein
LRRAKKSDEHKYARNSAKACTFWMQRPVASDAYDSAPC